MKDKSNCYKNILQLLQYMMNRIIVIRGLIKNPYILHRQVADYGSPYVMKRVPLLASGEGNKGNLGP